MLKVEKGAILTGIILPPTPAHMVVMALATLVQLLRIRHDCLHVTLLLIHSKEIEFLMHDTVVDVIIYIHIFQHISEKHMIYLVHEHNQTAVYKA